LIAAIWFLAEPLTGDGSTERLLRLASFTNPKELILRYKLDFAAYRYF